MTSFRILSSDWSIAETCHQLECCLQAIIGLAREDSVSFLGSAIYVVVK